MEPIRAETQPPSPSNTNPSATGPPHPAGSTGSAAGTTTVLDEARLEAETQRLGREILRLSLQHEEGLFSRDRLEKVMMAPVMQDPALRYRLLSFVDVYPALNSPDEISNHIEAYLGHDAEALQGGPNLITRAASLFGRAHGAVARPVAWASHFVINQMGHKFIAGDDLRHAVPTLRDLERDGFLFSLDLLGEAVTSERQADAYDHRYLEVIEQLGNLLGPPPAESPMSMRHAAGPRVNLSVKLSSLATRFDPIDPERTAADVLDRLRPLVRAARERGAFVHIDMERYEKRDLTLEIVRRLLSESEFRGFADLGVVLQAYLIDAEDSLEDLLGWLRARGQPLTIRLTKGAYWDIEVITASQRGWPVPVLTSKRETDAQFERMARRLLENHDLVRTAVASHNARSLAHALALCEALGVPPARFEAQMLFGMAGPIAQAVRELGPPVRIYTPCGELLPGMSYLVRRILENTSNESFLRQRFGEHVNETRLLADPKKGASR